MRRAPLPAGVRRTVRAAFHRAGFDLVRHSPTTRVRILRERRISLVLDVGANEGQWARNVRSSGYRGRLVSLEPLPAPYAALSAHAARDPAWSAVRAAAASGSGTAEVHVGADSRVSSLLRQTEQFRAANPAWRIAGREVVETRALDSLRPALVRPDDRVFLKADAQGAEAEVLDGARETLQQTEAIELELSLAPVYEGQELAPAMLTRLYGLGFVLVWLERAFVDQWTGYVQQVDGILVRTGSGARWAR
jgi:FkbM family methyltransferase